MTKNEKEMLECIQNLMGYFDTPIARRKISGKDANEVREIGRNILEKYETEDVDDSENIPDLSWLWHCSTRDQNVLDYSFLIDDDKFVPALNKAAQNGFRGCLRRLEDLEIIEMGDIDRSINRDDQHQFEIAFED